MDAKQKLTNSGPDAEYKRGVNRNDGWNAWNAGRYESAGRPKVRIRPKINLHFEVSRRSHDKARGGRIASYLTDEQRSHAGWIGASKCEVIFGNSL